MPLSKVIIVGAGPSGLLLTCMLARQGINVELLEATETLDNSPRAAHYAPPAAWELFRAGVLDDVNAQGFQPKRAAWRKIDGSMICDCSFGDVLGDYPYRMVVLPLDKLVKLLYQHTQKYSNAKVTFNTKVTDAGSDENGAWVEVDTPSGQQRMKADYVVGTDGASSTVRRCIFGKGSFEGETLDAQIIASNVYYDFEGKFGYSDSNFIVDRNNWYMAAKITTDGLYRVSYAETPGLTREEYIKRQPMRYEEILPGNPKPGDYKFVSMNPYQLQHRMAPSFHKGKVILCADSAHVVNPFGGLGLTGGIADVGSLYDALLGIHKGLADDSIIEKYSEVRMKIYKEIIDPMARENFKRISSQDPETAGTNDEWFKLCKKAADDLELQKQLCHGLDVLTHDFTQYWNKEKDVDKADGGKTDIHVSSRPVEGGIVA